MDIISVLISLVIYGLIFWVIWWGLAQIDIPEPFNKIIRVVIVLAVVVALISVLTGNTISIFHT